MAKVKQTVDGLHLPASVRVEYGGTYEEQQKSFRDLLRVLLLALALVFGVLLTEFRNFPGADRHSHIVRALDLRRHPGVAYYTHHIQCRLVHGAHHGDRHRGQERHSAA